jgi:hypothetical protein
MFYLCYKSGVVDWWDYDNLYSIDVLHVQFFMYLPEDKNNHCYEGRGSYDDPRGPKPVWRQVYLDVNNFSRFWVYPKRSTYWRRPQSKMTFRIIMWCTWISVSHFIMLSDKRYSHVILLCCLTNVITMLFYYAVWLTL